MTSLKGSDGNENTLKNVRTRPKNILFFNSDDRDQFIQIYDTIFECDNLTFLPSVIVSQMAEYSTGIVKKCANYNQCEQEIAILKEDKLEYYANGDYYYVRRKHLKQRTNPIYEMLKNNGNDRNVRLFCIHCALDNITRNIEQLHKENIDSLDILAPAHKNISYLIIEKEDNNQQIWQSALQLLNKYR